MSVRSVLAAEGLLPSRKKASHDELEAQFEVALQDLIKEAGLPPVRLTGVRSQKAEVVVPRGFDSLFKAVRIELTVKHVGWGTWGQLSWRYEHPGGGSNGVTIGTISVNAEDLQSGWHKETGEHRLFNAPRFPSDPF